MSDHEDPIDGESLLEEMKATIDELNFRAAYDNYLLGKILDRIEAVGIPENMAQEFAAAINATGDLQAVVRADEGAVYVLPRPRRLW